MTDASNAAAAPAAADGPAAPTPGHFERHFGPVAPEDRDAFLRAMPNAIVGTYRREAGPNMSPLWFLWTGEEFWISTLTWTAKVRNLRRDPRMSLCIDDPVGGEYVTAYGRAQIVEDGTVRERTLRLIRKYRAEEDVLPHWERIAADRVILVLRPDEMVWRDW